MTNNQTIVIFILLLFYLIGLGFLFQAIGHDININYTTTGQNVTTGVTGNIVTGYHAETTFIGDIVTGISGIPDWINTIFILIPAILLIILAILLLLHG